MEICKCRHFPTNEFRFDQKSPFHNPKSPDLVTVRCSLTSNLKSSELLSNKMFILGMGFVGQFLAADLKTKGWVVNGSCTSVAKKNKLEEMGHQAYVFDASHTQLEFLDIVKNHTHLVVSIPPVAGHGDPMLRHKGFIERVFKGGRLRWLVYLSTTSVYGDCGGAWVDEDYPVRPTSERIRDRLSAEEEWLSLGHNLGIAAHIFRLGGIYGPGRSAIDTITKQEPPSKSQKTRLHKNYTSRVHVADICQALNASILRPSPGKIYNIVDDDPAPRMEVFALAKKLVEEKILFHGKQYIFSERTESRVEEKGSWGEKRVSNTRMKKELGVKLLHPTYRSGLRSIIDHMDISTLLNSQGS